MRAQVHVRTFKVMPGRSDVVRSQAEGAVLELFNTRMAAVSLAGYIFFGSSVSISERVRAALRWARMRCAATCASPPAPLAWWILAPSGRSARAWGLCARAG